MEIEPRFLLLVLAIVANVLFVDRIILKRGWRETSIDLVAVPLLLAGLVSVALLGAELLSGTLEQAVRAFGGRDFAFALPLPGRAS